MRVLQVSRGRGATGSVQNWPAQASWARLHCCVREEGSKSTLQVLLPLHISALVCFRSHPSSAKPLTKVRGSAEGQVTQQPRAFVERVCSHSLPIHAFEKLPCSGGERTGLRRVCQEPERTNKGKCLLLNYLSLFCGQSGVARDQNLTHCSSFYRAVAR